MKAAGTINWDEIRDWLAEAGSICSGFHVEYQESRNPPHPLSARRRPRRLRRPPKADASISWVFPNRDT